MMLGFLIGLVAGAAATTVGLPLLVNRFPALGRLLARVPAPPPGIQALELMARIDAAIADIEQQIRDRVDVDRNGIRLAQLREVRGDA
jgi:hypothetical protein